jgi:hypothetical protein
MAVILTIDKVKFAVDGALWIREGEKLHIDATLALMLPQDNTLWMDYISKFADLMSQSDALTNFTIVRVGQEIMVTLPDNMCTRYLLNGLYIADDEFIFTTLRPLEMMICLSTGRRNAALRGVG